jgi:drug/metabolite transporter (DMT)-like permease
LNQDRVRLILPASLVIAILAVSTASIFIRFAQRDAPSLVIAALRLTFASLILAPVAATSYRRELKAVTRGDLLLGLLSGVFLAVHFATWITSLEFTSVASSVVLVSTGPLWVALLTPLFLKENLSRYVVIGLSLALAGGTIIGMGDACSLTTSIQCPPFAEFVRGRSFYGNFLALGGAWAVAFYMIIGRKLRARLSLIPYIFIVYGMAALVLLEVVFVTGKTLVGYSPATYLWVVLLALIPQLVGHSTYNWALRYLPAAMVSITTLGEPVGSAILAYFILSERPTLLTIFGGALILGGIYLASRGPRQPLSPQPRSSTESA